MEKIPANFFEIQYVETFSFYRIQHALDLSYNTSFQIDYPLAEMWSLHQTKNYHLGDYEFYQILRKD